MDEVSETTEMLLEFILLKKVDLPLVMSSMSILKV